MRNPEKVGLSGYGYTQFCWGFGAIWEAFGCQSRGIFEGGSRSGSLRGSVRSVLDDGSLVLVGFKDFTPVGSVGGWM